MAITKAQASKVRQPTKVGDQQSTGTLDGTTTTETIQLGIVAEKVTVQSDGTLAGNVQFSTNGVDFYTTTAFTATTPVTYSTHLITAIKVTRTGGTGKLSISAR
jgi:hypothetical protein